MVRVSVFIYLLFSTFSVIVFFLPLSLQDRGLSSGAVGTIIATGALIGIFAQPFWGYVSDKRKTVKKVLLVLLFANLFLSIGLFSVQTFLLILIFYITFMFFNSAAAPLTETLCISYAYQHNKEYGRLRVWGEIGVGTASLALGFIIEWIGIGYIWYIYAGGLILAIAAAFLIKDTESTPVPVNLKSLGKVFSQPRLLWFLFLILLIAIPHRMNDSLLALYISDMGASESRVGMAWLVATLSTVPSLMFAGKLIKKWNEMGIIIIATAAYALRWAIYSIADSPSVLIYAQALHSITFPLFLVAAIQYLMSIIPQELRGTGQAAFAVTFGGFAGIIGSAGGGEVFDRVSPAAAYGIGSLITVIAVVATIGTYLYNKRHNIPLGSEPSERSAEA
ncbi:MFS transporter [Xylanibacillus composti]|uniref:Putative transporter YwbF n=1 Tax=Xylanibacillus composti TaxID=1572762 RepID=A0A8J4H2V9_9BACL|nr:MFS transporter [Xylanibacillus composti]GIQ69943.1 putative transporter YwbF [Xylanibacillus composti]